MPIPNRQISIIIPAYNESETIAKVVSDVKTELNNLKVEHELIVVNDSSTDQTDSILRNIPGIKVVNQPYNKGQGAALKTGSRLAKFDWLLFFDADGQHRIESIKDLLGESEQYDMISGERTGYQGPAIRQPGKKAIHLLARYLLGKKIKDFNCGLRLIKKDQFLRFTHVLPDGFSWSTTSLFAFFKEGLNVKFVPVEVKKRQGGKSLVGPKVAVKYLMLIFRLVMLFSPLRIFLPVSFLLGILGLGFLIWDLTLQNISEGTIFILLSAMLIFFFGLIADQIAALRREINH